jgi:hypothetical protein
MSLIGNPSSWPSAVPLMNLQPLLQLLYHLLLLIEDETDLLPSSDLPLLGLPAGPLEFLHHLELLCTLRIAGGAELGEFHRLSTSEI